MSEKYYINKCGHVGLKPYESYYGYDLYSFDYFKNYSSEFIKSYNLSQEEIDQIMKEIQEEQNQLTFDFEYKPYKSSTTPVKFPENKCKHEMVEYVGLFESFKYCKLCNEKEK